MSLTPFNYSYISYSSFLLLFVCLNHFIHTEATIEPLSNGMLQQPCLTFKALVKNETSMLFKGWIDPSLYIQGESSWYELYDYQSTYVVLAPGETKELEYQFKNLPNGKNFSADIQYYVDDYWHKNSNTIWFTTDYVSETTNNMDIDISITGLDDNRETHSTIVSGSIILTNNNAFTDYVGKIWVTLQKYNWNTNLWELQTNDVPTMNIPADSSQVLRYRFDKLYNDATNGIAVFYQRDAEYLSYLMAQFKTNYIPVAGDADCDGKVNEMDIRTIVDAVNSNDLDVRHAADVNNDGTVNVADIIFTTSKMAK